MKQGSVKGGGGRSGDCPPLEVFWALTVFERHKIEPWPSKWRTLEKDEAARLDCQSVVKLLDENDEVLAEVWTPMRSEPLKGKARKTRSRLIVGPGGRLNPEPEKKPEREDDPIF